MKEILHAQGATGGTRLIQNKIYRGEPNVVNVVHVPQLHIFNLNVNQGAGILFVVTLSDGEKFEIVYAFLVDGGHANNKAQIESILKGHPLDAVCITHEDADHADCAILFTNVAIARRFLPRDPLSPSKRFSGTVPTQGTRTDLWPAPRTGAPWGSFPKLSIDWKHVWNGRSHMVDPPNSMSLAGLVRWGRFTYYFDGDLDDQRQDALGPIEYPIGADCTYVTHHGSKNSTSETFLANLNARTAIISSGANSFQHPTTFTLERLVWSAGIDRILLTNCDYNRPQANPKYWEREHNNFRDMRNFDIRGERPEDKLKRLEEYVTSLTESVEDMEAPATPQIAVAQQEILALLDKAAKRFVKFDFDRDLNAIATLQGFEYFDAAELTSIENYFRMLGTTHSDKVRLAGAHPRKSAIVMTLSGFDPIAYQTSYLGPDSQWAIEWTNTKAPSGQLAPAWDYCTVAPNDFYLLSERDVDCQHFTKSNRKARTFDGKARYKCSQCKKIIKELSEAVLFTCDPCGGQRSYHANCLVKLLEGNLNGVSDAVIKAISDHAYSDTVTDLLRIPAEVIVCPEVHSTRSLRSRTNPRASLKTLTFKPRPKAKEKAAKKKEEKRRKIIGRM